MLGALYFRDSISGHFSVDQSFAHICDFVQQYQAQVLSVEDAGLKDHLRGPLEQSLSRRGLCPKVVYSDPRKAKTDEERAAGLIWYYRTGLVFHNRNASLKLEHQQSQYPHCRKWDVLDAAAQIVSAMHAGGCYFAADRPTTVMLDVQQRQQVRRMLEKGMTTMRDSGWRRCP